MNLIDETAEIAEDVELGPFAVVGAGVAIGAGTRIGAHVVIHEGTVLGAGCEVQDGAVLGKSPKLARSSTALDRGARRRCRSPTGPWSAAARSCSRAPGSASGVIVGDQAYVRERAELGADVVVGRGSTWTTTSGSVRGRRSRPTST